MILDMMSNSRIYEMYLVEQGMPPNPPPERNPEDEMGPSPPAEEEEKVEPREFSSLKKHYLIGKLYDVKSRLTSQGIPHSELDNVLQFSTELTYDTLLRMANDVLDILKAKLSEVADDEEDSKTV